MPIEVVVLGDQSAELLSQWKVSERSDLSSISWENLGLEMVRRARNGSQELAEVYLCVQDEEIGSLDHGLIASLADESLKHTWGARLYVVIEPQRDGLELDACTFACKVMQAFLRSGVDDVLEMQVDLSDMASLIRLLQKASQRSRSREPLLRRPWRAVIAKSDKGLDGSRILLPLLESFRFRPGHPDLAVVVRSALPEKVVETIHDQKAERTAVIALQFESKQVLKEHCVREGIPLVEIRGPVELHYFLCRAAALALAVSRREGSWSSSRTDDAYTDYEVGLARLARHIGWGHQDLLPLETRLGENLRKERKYGSSESYRADRNEIIDQLNVLSLRHLRLDFNTLCRIEPPAKILVTQSFDPDAERDQCLLAARLVPLILREAPPGSSIAGHLAVDCQSLCAMIQSMEQPVHAWIFLGPADGPRGLREANSRQFINPQGWWACFEGKLDRLSLAVFVAGRSAETASHFARSGAACAVGFAAASAQEGFCHVIPRIVRAVFSERSDRDSQLQEISWLLEAFGFGDCKPQVFNAAPP